MSAPGRYCAPNRCYCGEPDCPAFPSYKRPLEPIMDTILDHRAVASGKRRSTPERYREARAVVDVRPGSEVAPLRED